MPRCPGPTQGCAPRRRAFTRVLGLALAVPLIVWVATATVLAQDPPNPLATVKAMKCRFPVAASGTWKDGQPQTATRTQELDFDIKGIDIQESTAEMTGTAGSVFVSAVLSGWSLYFVETSVGQLNVTTVFAQETGPKRLKAVHSRHGYLQMSVGRFISEPSVSQSYGECEISS